MVKAMHVVKVKVTLLAQQPINLPPFHLTSIGPAIREIQLLKILTLKIQGQGHGYIWGLIFNQYILFLFCGNQNILS